jgi:hypothetical protein
MTFYTDLLTLLETRIESAYNGTLAELGDQVPFDLSLAEMLKLRDYLTVSSGTSTTTTSVASSATSVSLLAANSNRKFASFRNDSTAIAYIELGATATTSSVYRLEAQGFLSLDNYTGAISCIWASANGNMRISEGE